MDNQTKAITGEFYTLAQLSHRGFIALLTLGRTKDIDVLVYNPKTNKNFHVEVKTTSERIWVTKAFGKNYEWLMNEKHENITNENLHYCFVSLRGQKELPRFFIVPSKDVAEYVKQQHKTWMELPRKKPVKNTGMRVFRIDATKPSKYENNWSVLEEELSD